MQTELIVLERDEARALYRKYKEHQHYAKPIDWEIQRTYQLIGQGRVVIKALESVTAAGLDDEGYPKLAICRADAERCFLTYWTNGNVRFAANQWTRERERRQYIEFPAGSFPRRRDRLAGVAQLPLIPLDIRPKRALENYHILWEAIWRPAPPIDPMLLRRIGQADLWVVLAAWDLTEVERAALAARIRV